MRRVVYRQTGDPDVLDLVEEPVPDPGPGQVRVRIHRSGVNPTDWKSRRGAEPGLSVDPPQTPGQDGAGIVDAVGDGVAAALLGLRVWVWEAAFQNPYGTAAEYSVVPGPPGRSAARRRARSTSGRPSACRSSPPTAA